MNRTRIDEEINLSDRTDFRETDWKRVPAEPGVYVIYDLGEVVYVGMAGRNGRGNLRNRLRDHSSGQIVNMFAQYLFLARVQFLPAGADNPSARCQISVSGLHKGPVFLQVLRHQGWRHGPQA